MKGQTILILVAAAAYATVLAALFWVMQDVRTVRAATTAAYWAVCPQAPADGCDYATIQGAVDAASPDDIIRVVGSNTYTENVVITKSLTLLGGCNNAACGVQAPGVFVTTIDGNGAGRVVTIEGEGDPITVMVDGFVITGGDATAETRHHYYGGGVGSWSAALTLQRSIIFSNVASTNTGGAGGGMYVLSGTVAISDNQVVDNRAGVSSSGEGGGVYLRGVSGVVGNNRVHGNVANTEQSLLSTVWGYGGGINVKESDSLTIDDNTIYSNTAALAGAGYGGGISLSDTQVSMSGNTIRENVGGGSSEPGSGGGVFIRKSEAALSHNWVVSNTASLNGIAYGGGVYIEDSTVAMQGDTLLYNTGTFSTTAADYSDGLVLHNQGSLTATNVLIARNSSPGGAEAIHLYSGTVPTSTVVFVNSTVASNTYRGLACAVGGSGALHLDVVNSILWGNGDELYNCGLAYVSLAYSDIEDTGNTGTGVIHQNPLFVDAAHDDFHLQLGSPCIDAGAGPAIYSSVPNDDWDEEPRPIVGYDIGADEAGGHAYLPMVLRSY